MRILLATLGFVDALNDRLGRILAYAVLMMFVLVLMEVIRRYVFNAPTVWGQELTQLTFGVYVILSGGHIMRWGGHVNVDILYTKFDRKTKAFVDIFTSILFFLFCGMLLIYGGFLAWDSMAYWERSISAWGPPLWIFKLMIPLGALLLLLQGIAKLIRDILTLATGIPYSPDDTSERESV
jgi:TRAP-type mannitol/chloroaromatic compound transport system permease small subunit